MSSQLSIKNLSCERDERELFANLSLDVNAGDIVQIAGPNGAGKTTLIRVITGLSHQFDGEILWQGKPAKGYHFYSSLLYFGHLPGVKSSMTAIENLKWYFGLNGIKDINGDSAYVPSDEELTQVLTRVGLRGYEDVPCFQMSAGQQRRVALARLYCSKAPLWILDEPFTAIDKKGVADLESTISDHAASGGMVVLTTHQPLNIDRVNVLDLGGYMRAAK